MEANTAPYAWIKKIPEAITQADTIPLLGDLPPFPWQELAQKLQELLEIKELEITPSEFVWMEEGEAAKGMGSPLSLIELSIALLKESFFIAIPESDVRQLMDILLLKESKLAPIDSQFQSAFLDFLTLETLNVVQRIGYIQEFSPKLVKDGVLPESLMLAMDVALSANGFKSMIRVLIPSSLNQALKQLYVRDQAKAPFQHPLASQIDVNLCLKGGSVTLSQEQWTNVKPGDFLLLDTCSLDPEQGSGIVTLTLKGHPVLRGKIENGNIEILENPLLHEDK